MKRLVQKHHCKCFYGAFPIGTCLCDSLGGLLMFSSPEVVESI